jgi:hypothetical protein
VPEVIAGSGDHSPAGATEPEADSAQGARSPAQDTADRAGSPARFLRLKATALLSVTVLVAVNLWTGAPLLALWVGSRVVGQQSLSMTAVFAVLASLAVLLSALTAALTWLGARYDKLFGRSSAGRRISPWLLSMRAEREDLVRNRSRATAVEAIVIASTVLATISLEIWFFFIAGSPLPS